MKLFDQSKTFARLAILLMVASIAACGGSNNDNNDRDTDQDQDPDPETAALEIIATSPDNDTTGVETNRNITATFNRTIDADTLDSFSFTVEGMNEAPVNGVVTFDAANDTATFTPEGDLGAETVYEATITTGVEDAEGIALENDFVWQFTTSSASDETAPSVTGTDPTDSATGVPLNRNVAATFSENLDSTTLTTQSFVVADADGNAVAGDVTIVGATTAVFNPENNFESESVYTATLMTDVTDLANPANALAADYVWSFTTGATAAEGPAPVVLGTAGDYVVLAKSEITTTGTTAIVGDLGISPAARSYMTGFDETLDASTEFATSALVTGSLYAASMTEPTPTNLTTAISNMETAYIDAAGRSNPDHTELGAGDISGMTLEPGLYNWGTNLLIASDITLSGSDNDVWILQIAQNLTVSNDVTITLEGGALPENIFWQVAGEVTLGTTSDMKGIILSKTKIVLQTGAVLNGRALAQTAVNLDANAVTQPAQ